MKKVINPPGQISSISCGQSKYVKTQLRFNNGCRIAVHLTNRGKLIIEYYDQNHKLIQQQTIKFSVLDETIETKLISGRK
ncbi:hypothetical protein LCGC14_2191580 [marine sediment metagenome]|uniref:Uncharacterized protein n=1 Tax=marine sediment metagenome TaxID=412755 RepID=A0A0F9FWU0_9ZZZZ